MHDAARATPPTHATEPPAAPRPLAPRPLERELTIVATKIVTEHLPVDAILAELRGLVVKLALVEHDGNGSRAARALGMDRTTFRRVVKAAKKG